MQWGSKQQFGKAAGASIGIGVIILVVGLLWNSFYFGSSVANVSFFPFVIALGTVIVGSGFILIGVTLTVVNNLRVN